MTADTKTEIARLIGLNKDTVNKYVNTSIESNKSLYKYLKDTIL